MSEIMMYKNAPVAQIVKGSSIPFDNTGTSLSSTNIQDAIAEVSDLSRYGMIMNSDIHTLDDFVHLLHSSTTARGFIGNINITTDIGVGVTGWAKIMAFANNPPNNGSANVLMYCWFFPGLNAYADPHYCIITGHTDGAYTVSEKGPFIGYNDKTFGITREASHTTSMTGYWAAMLNSNSTGSPVLPTSGKWWHVISMDWAGTTGTSPANDWVSQLAISTQDSGGGVFYRHTDPGGNNNIDNSSWNRLAEGAWNGCAWSLGPVLLQSGNNLVTMDFTFETQCLYIIILSITAGSGAHFYTPTIYLGALRENSDSANFDYTYLAGLADHPRELTSVTRISGNTLRLTASAACRWQIYRFLKTS